MLAILVYLSLVAACVVVGMTYGRWSVGGCCGCDPCVIQSNFNSSQWTGASWTFSGLTATGTGYAATSNSAAAAESYARVSINSMSNGDVVRLMIQVTDSDNYLYSEVEQVGSGFTLRVGSRTGGSDTVLNTQTSLFLNTYVLDVCFDSGTLVGSFGLQYASGAVSAKTGRKAAVSTSTSLTVSAFAFRERGGDCPDCTEPCGFSCNKCSTGTTGRYMAITVEGVVSGVHINCTTCENADGTYIAECSAPCFWTYTGSPGPSICTADEVTWVDLWVGHGGTTGISPPPPSGYIKAASRIAENASGGFSEYIADIKETSTGSGVVHCRTAFEEGGELVEFTYLGESGPANVPSVYCDWSGAIITIEPQP